MPPVSVRRTRWGPLYPLILHHRHIRVALVGPLLQAESTTEHGTHGKRRSRRSGLLRRGPEHLATLRRDRERWLDEHEYESLQQMQSSLSVLRCADPQVCERASSGWF
jgi:hypothetical protein